MALQGTLETFALPDVLRLLASTKKTGVLRVDTDRGTGELLVVDGALTGGAAERAPRAEEPADVLFELLRAAGGSFVFDADADASGGRTSQEVESALAVAEEQLGEWRQIEAVVPSPHRLVTIDADRDSDITLTAGQWKAVATVGSGCTVDELGDRLGLAELPTARLVRDLVQIGAVALGDHDVVAVDPPASAAHEAPAPAPVAAVPAPAPDPEPVAPQALPDPEPFQPLTEAPAPVAEEPFTSSSASFEPLVEEPSSNGAAPVAPLFGGAADAPSPAEPAPTADSSTWGEATAFAPSPASSFFDDDESDDDPLADDPFGPDPFRIPRLPSAPDAVAEEDSDAAEMARQLANLSPRAAQAVAAAAAATSEEERDQALAQVNEETEEPLNRGLLLKFLSSVDE
ncbi:DUF4388 domain-containing protein [Actinomarinicola tropica]|uniref:DUF4388 domain-containing protein n=1 Tax=Actinomarinicola tropica TaxID=2789776 RepID=A0A5Q2RE74_9ACTN|nr:DUF4388 domain-containing protein [Actinomarinicola tropica]QGG95169.1 DUF4388 domain-containing protein [Actinomarinicola tropica]